MAKIGKKSRFLLENEENSTKNVIFLQLFLVVSCNLCIFAKYKGILTP